MGEGRHCPETEAPLCSYLSQVILLLSSQNKGASPAPTPSGWAQQEHTQCIWGHALVASRTGDPEAHGTVTTRERALIRPPPLRHHRTTDKHNPKLPVKENHLWNQEPQVSLIPGGEGGAPREVSCETSSSNPYGLGATQPDSRRSLCSPQESQFLQLSARGHLQTLHLESSRDYNHGPRTVCVSTL